MFLGINDNHGMTNSTSKFVSLGSMNSHVSDQIGNLSHLLLLTRRDRRLTVIIDFPSLSIVSTTINCSHPIIGRIRMMRIETLQSIKSGGTFNRTFVIGDKQY